MSSALERLCLEQGIRLTEQRRVIAGVLAAAADHPDVEELYRRASRIDDQISLATVYRTLKNGVEGGWLTQVELPGEPPRYEATGKQHHHHFHCRSCDRVYEIEGCPDDLRNLTPPGFALEAHEIVLYGRCADCAR